MANNKKLVEAITSMEDDFAQFRQRWWQSARKFLATIQTIRWRIRSRPIM